MVKIEYPLKASILLFRNCIIQNLKTIKLKWAANYCYPFYNNFIKLLFYYQLGFCVKVFTLSNSPCGIGQSKCWLILNNLVSLVKRVVAALGYEIGT